MENDVIYDSILDNSSYKCSICLIPLRFKNRRAIPDELCMQCYHTWKEEKGLPWLKHLISREQSRRTRLRRYRKQGIDYNTISYEDYIGDNDA